MDFVRERMITMKKLISILLLSLLLFLNPSLSQNPHHTEAATVSYVLAKQDIYLREYPNKDARKITTIKNHSEVKVFSSNKTWSYIQTGKAKGYVYTNALTKRNPQKIKTPPIITGELSPKAGRSYTYAPSFEEDGRKMTYTASMNYGVTELLAADGFGYAYLESAESFELGIANSDVFFFSLSYPMKKGSTIHDTEYGIQNNTVTEVLVESITHTLETAAGTFHDVVVLHYPNGAQLYLAQDHGVIKIIDSTGKTTTELVAVN